MKIPPKMLAKRVLTALKEKGPLYVFRIAVSVISERINPKYYLYYKFKYKFRPKEFTFRGERYRYFCHWYNKTYRNMRAVEVPVVWRSVNGYRGKNILEVGNVLSHYFKIDHDILDKYEWGEGIINEDAADFKPHKKYDLIISISTLEHAGWDEIPREQGKVYRALENLRGLLGQGGKMVVTLPLGYNHDMDKLIKEGVIKFNRMFCMRRTSGNNEWQETGCKEALEGKMDYPNWLLIGIIER